MTDWLFADTPTTAFITTRQVLEGATILLVTHDADDGAWQFLCGTTDDPEGRRASRAAADLPWEREPARA